MIERLSGDFVRGYTKAIQDISEIVLYVQSDLKHHKKTLNAKTMDKLMKCCLINRENIREKRNGFIRWNSQKNDFEWHDTRREDANT